MRARTIDHASALVKTLLPSFGYFGGGAADHLVVPVGSAVRGVVVRRVDKLKNHLHLRGVQLFADGALLDVRDRIVTVGTTPPPEEPPATEHVLWDLDGIFSGSQARPSWTVELSEPVHVDEIHVHNRLDGYALRSRYLAVDVIDPDGTRRLVHATSGQEQVDRTMDLLERLVGRPVGDDDVEDAEDARAWRQRVVTDVVAALRAGAWRTVAPQEWLLLLSLVPTRTGQQLEGDDYALLGLALVEQRHRVPGTPSGLRSFARVLSTRAMLDEVARAVTEAAELLGLPPQMLTHHGLRDAGVLRREPEQQLAIMRRLVTDMESLGHHVLLAYGTLLGAVREGRFMAHDDDVDLWYDLPARSDEEMWSRRDELFARLEALGWEVEPNGRYVNAHVTRADLPGRLDLFPLQLHRRKAALAMEHMEVRRLPRSIFLPPGRASVEGVEFAVPRRSERFLAERYGPGWRTPDPYHEWTWRLTDQ
ncbi:MAG: hypothetical protein PGN07_12280 [Aeromicrobium erythreum]